MLGLFNTLRYEPGILITQKLLSDYGNTTKRDQKDPPPEAQKS